MIAWLLVLMVSAQEAVCVKSTSGSSVTMATGLLQPDILKSPFLFSEWAVYA